LNAEIVPKSPTTLTPSQNDVSELIGQIEQL